MNNNDPSSYGLVARRKLDGLGYAAVQLRTAQTRAERVLWQKLRANRLHGLHFRRQQIVDRFIVDFYCHRAKLAVEIDGEIHDGREAVDTERDARLLAYGVCVLRFSNDDIMRKIENVTICIGEVAMSRIDIASPNSIGEAEQSPAGNQVASLPS